MTSLARDYSDGVREQAAWQACDPVTRKMEIFSTPETISFGRMSPRRRSEVGGQKSEIRSINVIASDIKEPAPTRRLALVGRKYLSDIESATGRDRDFAGEIVLFLESLSERTAALYAPMRRNSKVVSGFMTSPFISSSG